MTNSVLNTSSRVYLAGHRGMVGSAILRLLQSKGHTNLVTRTHAELDLLDQGAVRHFFKNEKIDYVVLAAAKVGGIHANNTYRADFIYENLMVEAHVIHEAYKAGVERLLFLGSSCIYPRLAMQPMKEEYLLTGLLEPTNEPYAVAKIAGIKLCESYNRQYGTQYRAVMPTNLYGPNDSYSLKNSHLMAALIRKFHLAKLATEGNWDGILKDESTYGPIPEDIKTAMGLDPVTNQPINDSPPPKVALWGTGSPRREFLHVDDMADACIHVMSLSDEEYESGLSPDTSPPSVVSPLSSRPSFYNIGTGKDHTIKALAGISAEVIGFTGIIDFDPPRPDGDPATLDGDPATLDGMPQKLLDVSRLTRLGWQPKISLRDGIKGAYADYLKGQD